MKLLSKIIYYCFGLILLLMVNNCFADIVIKPHTVISSSQTYSNDTLDMTYGSFFITNNATLTIKNCVIKGNLSKDNPNLFNIDSGFLKLYSNTVNVIAQGLDQHPTTQSLYNVIQVALGNVVMKENSFRINQSFTAGLLITTASIATSGFEIVRNRFEKFHGVLYLLASDNALIQDNFFFTNTYGHIVNMGNNSKIIGNTISFSGNDRLGNSMDIFDSENITISKNLLLTPTCHGIYVLNSHNVVIDSNQIHGGITYAINILTFPEKQNKYEYLSHIIPGHGMKHKLSSEITISNNFMSQNRFGIAASDVDNLVVNNNYFIQRFGDNDARKFWTDNNILLSNVTNLTWTNNIYKEAFTQDISGDNSKSLHLITFPATGGVTL